MSATTSNPPAVRDELLSQAADVSGRGAEFRDAVRAAQFAAHEAEAALTKARIASVRGTATDADMLKAEKAAEKAREAVEQLTEESNVVAAASAQIDRELWRLHWNNRPAFEAEADAKSRAAEDALRALQPQLQEAARLWADAAAAWDFLSRQLTHTNAPALDRNDPLVLAGNPQAPYGMPGFPLDADALGSVEARPYPRALDA